MILSMTGFGDARRQDERLSVAVEVRTVNNRYLKISIRCPDAYAALESEIERIVREKISRGTVNVTIRVEHPGEAAANPVDVNKLQSILTHLKELARQQQIPFQPDLNALATWPGVITDETHRHYDVDAEWPVLQQILQQSLDRLHKFRVEEGRSMLTELSGLGRIIQERLAEVTQLAPQVISDYRAKLLDRVRQVLTESDVTVTESDLIREVSVFADRTDITEEITRLRCHLDQFETFLQESTSAGRKLDFLSQEMFREVNTIGSKANNVPIAHCVVDMKAAVEKIREILQNVE